MGGLIKITNDNQTLYKLTNIHKIAIKYITILLLGICSLQYIITKTNNLTNRKFMCNITSKKKINKTRHVVFGCKYFVLLDAHHINEFFFPI